MVISKGKEILYKGSWIPSKCLSNPLLIILSSYPVSSSSSSSNMQLTQILPIALLAMVPSAMAGQCEAKLERSSIGTEASSFPKFTISTPHGNLEGNPKDVEPCGHRLYQTAKPSNLHGDGKLAAPFVWDGDCHGFTFTK